MSNAPDTSNIAPLKTQPKAALPVSVDVNNPNYAQRRKAGTHKAVKIEVREMPRVSS